MLYLVYTSVNIGSPFANVPHLCFIAVFIRSMPASSISESLLSVGSAFLKSHSGFSFGFALYAPSGSVCFSAVSVKLQ